MKQETKVEKLERNRLYVERREVGLEAQRQHKRLKNNKR